MNSSKSEDHTAAQTRKSSGAHSYTTIDPRLERKLFAYGLETSVNKLAELQSNGQAVGLKSTTVTGPETERPYQCDTCLQKFCQSSNLKRHMLIHTGERPFVCTFCNRTFTTASNMKIHKEIHKESGTRDKHKCSACNKAFFYKCSLVKHQKKCQKQAKTEKKQESDKLGEEPHKVVKKEEAYSKVDVDPSLQAANPINPLFLAARAANPLQSLLTSAMIPSNSINAFQSMLAFPTINYQQLLLNQMLMDSLNLSMMRNSANLVQDDYLKSVLLKQPSATGMNENSAQDKP